ncbi:MAG: hypothetical protein HYW06_10835 [Gemmatimonadetes bacterium]|nr:hypothetical protein [Gemmatimonadota bacterium]
MTRFWPLLLLLLAATAAMRQPGSDQRGQGTQCETSLTGRWVGLHQNQTLHLEFYGDTMLVVNDQYPLTFRATSDSLTATGDTTVAARYWFSFCRLLLETPDHSVVTMSSQGVLARPLTGRWVGGLGTPDGAEAELRLAPSGTARWHLLPDGPWTEGEWERQTRIITFTWAGSDTIPWVGHYDVEGNAILFERTVPNSRTAIFHRVFR